MEIKVILKENVLLIAAITVLVLGVAFYLTACAVKTYNVDYCGEKNLFIGAKDSYRAGAKVKLYYNLIATDTDYSFYLDGESINADYDDKKGFVICFTMPEHDVKLECKAVNSMVRNPNPCD